MCLMLSVLMTVVMPSRLACSTSHTHRTTKVSYADM
jgi:hypothetical protein